ncbi:hypothetical protein [Mucilaginibacter flavidus]|uniref:hypothetical protein n=1 Tax=Mucilaginibacter flavidus TaxID=2949309 RepID=UPI0020936DD8|nr:hypothetical protein [Mucilaginibacter flavidus]MCO5946791.1 hypothetical protein [Mucilaginibacter flavidus]
MIKQKNGGGIFLLKTPSKKWPLLTKNTGFAANVVDFETSGKCTAQKLPHKIHKTAKPPGNPGGLIMESASFENDFWPFSQAPIVPVLTSPARL